MLAPPPRVIDLGSRTKFPLLHLLRVERMSKVALDLEQILLRKIVGAGLYIDLKVFVPQQM